MHSYRDVIMKQLPIFNNIKININEPITHLFLKECASLLTKVSRMKILYMTDKEEWIIRYAQELLFYTNSLGLK